MKKIICLLLSLVLIMSFAVGCNPNKDNSSSMSSSEQTGSDTGNSSSDSSDDNNDSSDDNSADDSGDSSGEDNSDSLPEHAVGDDPYVNDNYN